jgi:hypothetical protein
MALVPVVVPGLARVVVPGEFVLSIDISIPVRVRVAVAEVRVFLPL